MSSLHQSLSGKRKFIMRKRILRRGATNFVRNSWLSAAAVIVMSITLLTVFVSGVATLVLNGTVDDIKTNKLDLPLYLKNDTPEEVYSAMQAELQSDPNVASVTVTTSAELAKKAGESVSADTRDAMVEVGINLDETMPIQMSIKAKNTDDVEGIKEIVLDDFYESYIDNVNYYDKQFYNSDNSQTVATIANWAAKIQLVGLVLGGVFLLITVLVIFNTIRMAIFARKDEIEMEKLIGAERNYIRGPFLVEAEMYGVIAGAITVAGGYAAVAWLDPWLSSQGLAIGLLHHIMFDIPFALFVIAGTILVGFLIAEISARFAVRKYLKY